MAESVLVLQTAFLGDCILSLPFLARLAELEPNREIHIVTAPAGEGVFRRALDRGLAGMSHRTRLLLYRKRGEDAGFRGFLALASRVRRSGQVEKAFCLQRSARTAALAIASKARERIGFSSGAASYLYTNSVGRDWNSGRSEIEKNLDLLRAAYGREVAPWDPRTAPSILGPDDETPRRSPEAPVLIALGSPWPTKRWPTRHAKELVVRLLARGQRVKLVGDPSAVPLAAEVRAGITSPLLEDLCGRTSIASWLDEIAAAKVVVSGDSAAVHAASDLRTPVVALFGPTLPDFGFAPWRAGSLALGVSHLECRPCHIHGPKVCPLGHHRCLEDLGGDHVYKRLLRYL